MSKILSLISKVILFLLINSHLHAHIEHYDKINSLEYELFRNDKKIGYHKYEFERKNEILTVKSIVEFKIIKLGVVLYKYDALSEEIYKDNKLFKFTATTNQNKKKKYADIKYNKQSDTYTIDGSSYQGPSPNDFLVGTWWNHEITNKKAQISAVSGRIIEQKVTFLGKEKIEIDGKTYNTLRYNFSSFKKGVPDKKKLNTDIWYDEENKLWIKASFDKTGYWEYRLKHYN